MPNLPSIFKHEELSLTVLRLLTNKHPVVQQAAFNVWFNLSPKGVAPYREDLEKILPLQSFREAVSAFKLDTSVAPKDSPYKLISPCSIDGENTDDRRSPVRAVGQCTFLRSQDKSRASA
ncbi:hypothetical protein AAHC03_01188 [Spirometra sp. Aus1]